jgi:hypothetical protein
VIIAYADLQLLAAVLVLLWPFGIVFPGRGKFLGQYGLLRHSTYFKISLSFTIRLISANNVSLTHTMRISNAPNMKFGLHTFFPDEGIIAIVGVVRISGGCAATVPEHAKIEL